ncbi:MAG: hypothetical protein PHU55_02530 [Bacilli bacterium]|nr:hypothetical protein [Bacilli bacterium]
MKPNKSIALVMLSVLILSGCDLNGDSSSNISISRDSSSNSDSTVVLPNYYHFNDKPASVTMAQARKGEIKSDMPRSARSRVLVVPIEFADFPAENMLRGAEGAREDIRKAYFGTSEETQWESLKSYYAKSSYGKVEISGQVMPWYRPGDPNDSGSWFTTQELLDGYSSAGEDTGISRLILGWIYTDYSVSLWRNVKDDNGVAYASRDAFFQDYDGDHDGFIDVVQMVYSAPIQHLDSDLFWAFRSADNAGTPRPNRPMICGFVWLGYDFLYENGYYDELGAYHDWTPQQIIDGEAKIDAHTIIHESGHALGANDYYTYDSKDWGPMGGTDMMDYNVGDHNAYTKSIFGWADPIVVTGESSVTVKSFTDTGEAILLPAYREDGAVNNSLFENYIMIEYYRPTGLNEMDATKNYSGNYPKMPNIPGIRVYHVDSRLGLFTYGSSTGWQFVRYVSTVTGTDSNSYIGVANSNTKSYSANPNNRLIHALEVSGENTLKNSSFSPKYSSSMMWQEGDTFGVDTFVNFTLNNGEKLGYKFAVTAMNDEEVTIEFSLA